MNTTHKHTIQLSRKELVQLQNIIKRGKHNTRTVTRARILLLSHKGSSKSSIAHHLEINRSTVQSVRDHFHDGHINRALYDAPRPGQPPKITEKVEAHLVAVACSDPPNGHDSWTLEMLQQKLVADKKLTSISTVAIWHHLHERGIKPWRGKNVVRTEAHA